MLLAITNPNQAVAWISYLFVVLAGWTFCSRAGYRLRMRVLMLVPGLNGLILLLLAGIADWPLERRHREAMRAIERFETNWLEAAIERFETDYWLDALQARDKNTRVQMASSLRVMGETMRSCEQRLAECMDAPEVSVQLAAAEALWQINLSQDDRLVGVGLRAIDSTEWPLRCRGVELLADLGRTDDNITARMVDGLQDEELKVRRVVAMAIARLKPRHQSVTDALERAAGESDPALSKAAKLALEEIAGGSKEEDGPDDPG
ncbi:MAG: hypothetical protein VB861_08405 [Planctomycetaceae bacterium]